jgi:hypothetical protein
MLRQYIHRRRLIGATIKIRHDGRITRTGTIDHAMTDSTALWIPGDAARPRTMYETVRGIELWADANEVEDRLAQTRPWRPSGDPGGERTPKNHLWALRRIQPRPSLRRSTRLSFQRAEADDAEAVAFLNLAMHDDSRVGRNSGVGGRRLSQSVPWGSRTSRDAVANKYSA